MEGGDAAVTWGFLDPEAFARRPAGGGGTEDPVLEHTAEEKDVTSVRS